MEFLKWLIMIVAIFVLLVVGCYFLLKSEERKRQNTKLYHNNVKKIQQTNEMLDEVIEELETYNEPLRMFSDQITAIKDNFLNHK